MHCSKLGICARNMTASNVENNEFACIIAVAGAYSPLTWELRPTIPQNIIKQLAAKLNEVFLKE